MQGGQAVSSPTSRFRGWSPPSHLPPSIWAFWRGHYCFLHLQNFSVPFVFVSLWVSFLLLPSLILSHLLLSPLLFAFPWIDHPLPNTLLPSPFFSEILEALQTTDTRQMNGPLAKAVPSLLPSLPGGTYRLLEALTWLCPPLLPTGSGCRGGLSRTSRSHSGWGGGRRACLPGPPRCQA